MRAEGIPNNRRNIWVLRGQLEYRMLDTFLSDRSPAYKSRFNPPGNYHRSGMVRRRALYKGVYQYLLYFPESMGCLGIFKVGALAEKPIERVWCSPNKERKPEAPTHVEWVIHQLAVKLPNPAYKLAKAFCSHSVSRDSFWPKLSSCLFY